MRYKTDRRTLKLFSITHKFLEIFFTGCLENGLQFSKAHEG